MRRLIDLTVEEVSIVDKPANMTKFTLIKRADPETTNDAEVAAKLAEIKNELGNVGRMIQDANPDGNK